MQAGQWRTQPAASLLFTDSHAAEQLAHFWDSHIDTRNIIARQSLHPYNFGGIFRQNCPGTAFGSAAAWRDQAQSRPAKRRLRHRSANVTRVTARPASLISAGDPARAPWGWSLVRPFQPVSTDSQPLSRMLNAVHATKYEQCHNRLFLWPIWKLCASRDAWSYAEISKSIRYRVEYFFEIEARCFLPWVWLLLAAFSYRLSAFAANNTKCETKTPRPLLLTLPMKLNSIYIFASLKHKSFVTKKLELSMVCDKISAGFY